VCPLNATPDWPFPCGSVAALQLLAVKFVPRPLPKAAVPLMLAEVELQAQLGEGHVNIITMRELMLTRTHLGLVMDYASGATVDVAVCGWGGGGVVWGVNT
jgi:hypothetical protein